METSRYEQAVSAELNDLRREREILAEELLSGKNAFASQVKDVLGEQIMEALKDSPSPIKQPAPKKPSKFKTFIEKLISVIQ